MENVKLSVIVYNRRSTTTEGLGEEISNAIKDQGPVTQFSGVLSPDDKGVVFTILHEPAKGPMTQRVFVSPLDPHDLVVEQTNKFLKDLGADWKIKAMNFYPQSGSRALAVVIAEAPMKDVPHGRTPSESPKAEQDQNADAKPNPRAARGAKHPNRGADRKGVGADNQVSPLEVPADSKPEAGTD